MVVVVEAPESFIFAPMQINTRNPDGSGKRCAENCPLPKNSKAPFNATYSGILECPCTTRVTKEMGGYITQANGVCNGALKTAGECFSAAATVIARNSAAASSNLTVSDPTVPAGCFVTEKADGTFDASFNSLSTSTTACGMLPPGIKPILAGSAESVVGLGLVINGTDDVVTITLTVSHFPVFLCGRCRC
jgi:hypothetical protein